MTDASINDVFPKVRDCLADSLALNAADISLNARLISDLGADSLDFLDIIFSLEKAFAIKLRNSDLDSLLRADFSENRLINQQFIPRAEIDKLVAWLPALKSAPDLDAITPSKLFTYITVESLAILVHRKLAGA